MTSSTIGGGLRALLVATGLLNERVFRDSAPDSVTYPMAIFTDGMSDSPVLIGDEVTVAKQRQSQVSLWQKQGKEDYALIGQIERALDGARFTALNGAVYRVRVRDTQRVPQPEQNLVHHAITVAIWHDAAAS